MGARGRVRMLGDRIRVRFYADTEAEIRVLAAMWSTAIPSVVRILTDEALRARQLNRNGIAGMSRRIDVTDPENLTDEDQAYLASRGRSPEQEADRQDRIEYVAERIVEQAAHEERMSPEDIAYQRRIGNLG